jgi:hypothetical protein
MALLGSRTIALLPRKAPLPTRAATVATTVAAARAASLGPQAVHLDLRKAAHLDRRRAARLGPKLPVPRKRLPSSAVVVAVHREAMELQALRAQALLSNANSYGEKT